MTSTTDKITVRECRPDDASSVARLFMMAWPVEDFLAMDRTMTECDLHSIVTGLVASEGNLYSYSNTLVAELSGESGKMIAGAMNSYDGALYETYKKRVQEAFAPRFGEDSMSSIRETEAGEYYLDSVGVDPSVRSMGVGTMLFEATLRKAADMGFAVAGLIVDIDKPKAEALYLRLGFREVGMKDYMGHRMKHMQKQLDR